MGSRRAPALVAVVAAVTIALARCTTDGLDDYARGYDAGPQDAAPDVAADAPPADGGNPCDCGLGQACVHRACETCAPTWSLDFPSVAANDHAFDVPSAMMYVAGSRSVGDAGATTGWLGVIDECTGKLERALDAPAVGGATLQGMNNPGLAGGKLYVRLYAPAPSAGGYARFDLTTQAFDLAIPTLPSLSQGNDETWMMATSASGNVWWSGDLNWSPGPPSAAVGKASAAGVCWKGYPSPNGSGRALAIDGPDVYVAAASASVVIHHFDDAACAPPACACAPTWSSPALTINGRSMGAMRLRVVGTKLYALGWSFVDDMGSSWEGFVATLDLVTHTWNQPFTWDPTPRIDAFVAADVDATYLYLSAAQGWDGITWVSAAAKVVVLPRSFNGPTSVSVLDVPRLRVGWNLALDRRGGFVLAGLSTDNGNDGRAIRCSLQTCPP